MSEADDATREMTPEHGDSRSRTCAIAVINFLKFDTTLTVESNPVDYHVGQIALVIDNHIADAIRDAETRAVAARDAEWCEAVKMGAQSAAKTVEFDYYGIGNTETIADIDRIITFAIRSPR